MQIDDRYCCVSRTESDKTDGECGPTRSFRQHQKTPLAQPSISEHASTAVSLTREPYIGILSEIRPAMLRDPRHARARRGNRSVQRRDTVTFRFRYSCGQNSVMRAASGRRCPLCRADRRRRGGTKDDLQWTGTLPHCRRPKFELCRRPLQSQST